MQGGRGVGTRGQFKQPAAGRGRSKWGRFRGRRGESRVLHLQLRPALAVLGLLLGDLVHELVHRGPRLLPPQLLEGRHVRDLVGEGVRGVEQALLVLAHDLGLELLPVLGPHRAELHQETVDVGDEGVVARPRGEAAHQMGHLAAAPEEALEGRGAGPPADEHAPGQRVRQLVLAGQLVAHHLHQVPDDEVRHVDGEGGQEAKDRQALRDGLHPQQQDEEVEKPDGQCQHPGQVVPLRVVELPEEVPHDVDDEYPHHDDDHVAGERGAEHHGHVAQHRRPSPAVHGRVDATLPEGPPHHAGLVASSDHGPRAEEVAVEPAAVQHGDRPEDVGVLA
mmetsp:Transcript_72439/g.212552  ORF Transcript_72439/g.212552 Transcript_72439/m.212552 type:complete len:335 (-) Transcript_72439:335-1339(-)